MSWHCTTSTCCPGVSTPTRHHPGKLAAALDSHVGDERQSFSVKQSQNQSFMVDREREINRQEDEIERSVLERRLNREEGLIKKRAN